MTSQEAGPAAFELRASVLSHFDADWIADADTDDDELVDFLLGSCDRVDGPDGQGFWRLDGRDRARIWRTHELKELAHWSDQLSTRPDSELQHAIDHVLHGHRAALDDVDDAELRSWWTIRQWTGDSPSIELPLATEISTELDRRRITAPLRATLDEHVVGRSELLEEVTRHVLSFSGEPLVIHGVGGVGKSTVLATLLLGRLPDDVSFAYLNFDRGTLTARRPHHLLDEIVRQIAELTPGVDQDAVSDWRRRLRDESQSSLGLTSAASEIQVQAGVPPEMIAELAKVDGIGGRTFVVALDTYEEIQRRAPSDAFLVWDLVRDLSTIMGGWSVVAAGRAPVPEAGGASIHLDDLAIADARLLLGALLDDERAELIDRLVDLVGRNPLSLRLAAEAVNRTDVADPMQLLDVVDGNVQGQLYARILDHIADDDVRKIAHPGLVVRRLTPDMIGPVLAAPCELDLTSTSADELLAALEAEATLVERATDGALVHRADVRALMLPALKRVQPAKVERIHELAVAHYSSHDDTVSATEALYHRLMLGERVSAIPSNADIDSVISSIDELPAAGQMLLGTLRPGLALSKETLAQADDDNWAQLTVAEARSALRAGRPQVALDLVRRRTGPGGQSLLPSEEIQALERLGSLDRAAEIAKRALDDARATGDMTTTRSLTRTAARLAERLGRHDDALATIRPLVDVYLRSQAPREHDRAVEELIDLSTYLRLNRRDQRRSDVEHAARVAGYANILVEALPDRVLANRSSLLRDLAAELGTGNDRVVRLALEAVGVEEPAAAEPVTLEAPSSAPMKAPPAPSVKAPPVTPPSASQPPPAAPRSKGGWHPPSPNPTTARTRVTRGKQVTDEALAEAVTGYQAEADRSVGYSRFRIWNDEAEEYRLTLQETSQAGRFRLSERFIYQDRHHDDPFVVPRLIDEFSTDLTSLPRRLMALDPGTHYARPAVLLEAIATQNYSGPNVDLPEAHRIYRDALRELGMQGWRRWVVWTALDWTAGLSGRLGRLRQALYWVVLATAVIISFLWPSLVHDPTLNDSGLAQLPVILFSGFGFCMGIAACAAPLFGRRWRSGAMAAFAIAIFGLLVTFGVVFWVLYVRIPLWIIRKVRSLIRRSR